MKITCPICNKQFKRISTTHLKYTHNITYTEFFAKYPNSPIEHPNVVLKRKQTLANMILRHGDELGKLKWQEYIDKQAYTNSYEYKQSKFNWSEDEFINYNKSRANIGEKNGNYGKGFYKIWIEKYGEDEANRRMEQFKQTQSINSTDCVIIITEDAKQRMRESAINRIRKNNGIWVSYNKESIPIIESYGKENGYNFQHAENGGEVQICGYFVDGFDVDNNVVIEYDEKHHFNKHTSELREKDMIRQRNIINNINCKFIRIDYTGKITIYEKNY